LPSGRFATVARLNIDQLKDPKAENRQVAAPKRTGERHPGSAVRIGRRLDEVK
jgi:hypothetical protein